MHGNDYDTGDLGLPRDPKKAMELWLKAGELGDELAHYNIGCAYLEGCGVEQSEKKAIHFYQLAAMGGHPGARYNLAATEHCKGNIGLAMKHFRIAAGTGHDDSLKAVKQGFTKGQVSKSQFEETLREHQQYNEEIKSAQREEAVKSRAIDTQMANLLGREAWMNVKF